MQCPKCDGEVETVGEHGSGAVRIDWCNCHGTYVDQLTRPDLALVEGLAGLDARELRQYVSDECREEFEALLPGE